MSPVRRLTGAAAAAVLSLGVSVLLGEPQAAAVAGDCTLKRGGELTQPPWPDTRLGFRDVWPITRGKGVRVAVLDSGVATDLPQTRGIAYSDPTNVVTPRQPVYDCTNHGTAVTAIIAGQSGHTVFSGVAPQATVIPIKVSQGETNADGTSALVAGIKAAVKAKAQVANISVTVPNPRADLLDAVRLAAAHHLILVCAGGNDGTNSADVPLYPAAYSTGNPNVIAVSAVDRTDASVYFSSTGSYIDVAAPGAELSGLFSGGGFGDVSGTSYAAPYVTGTVALMLAAHPAGLTFEQVRHRLEATADAPPATVPDSRYGYGIVNPYLAVTSVGDTAPPSASPAAAAPLPAIPPRAAPDRHLQHVALAVAGALVGLLIVVAATAGVLRSGRRRASTRRA